MKRLILIIAACFFFVPGKSQNTDIDMLRKINTERNRCFDNPFRLITNTAGPISFGLPAAVYGYGLWKNDTCTKNKGFYLGLSLLVSSGVSTAMKFAINRDRPFVTYDFIEKETHGGSPSFPSGHTSAAFNTATSVSICYPKAYIIIPTHLWAAAVGYSRMHLGVHYPSDVIAGAFVGSATAWLSYKANKYINKKKNKCPKD